MKKIMIVEDDVMYRYALRTVINWEEHGFTIEEEAINGQDAINKLSVKEPDILITDISMPELDGIGLIKHVKQHYPHIKIIVLSSYDDYKFVRDALLLGAEDYILKLELEEDKLVGLLSKIKNEVEKEYYIKSIGMENLLIKDMITGQSVENLSVRLNKAKKDFYPGVFMNIECDNLSSDDEYEMALLFHNILNSKIHDYILGLDNNKCYILIDIRRIKSESKIHSYLEEISYYLIKELHIVGINCQIGISDIFYDISKLTFHCKQAVIALQYSFYEKDKKIFFYSDNLISNKNQKLDTLLNDLKESTLCGDVHKVEIAMNNIFEFICKYKLAKNDLKKVLLDLYILYHNIMRELHQEHISKSHVVELLINEEIHDVSALKEEYQYYYSQLCKRINNQKKYSLGVHSTIEYIDENYKLSNLTVDKIAQSLDITPNYLSNIFKKETGVKITEYLNNLKINEAKRLLRTSNKKVYEIADDVGFNNVTYFCTLFKRKIGVTVKEYRNQGKGYDVD